MRKRDGSLCRDGSVKRGRQKSTKIVTTNLKDNGLLVEKGSFLVCGKCRRAVLRTKKCLYNTDPILTEHFSFIDGSPVSIYDLTCCKYCGESSKIQSPLSFYMVVPQKTKRR